MYYQNGNYMQDLNYYNQTPNYNYNQYMNNQMPVSQMPMQNINAMYPATYRIISPVASQVLSNNNIGYLTDDGLNRMVDAVYNIVEGDINFENTSNSASAQSNDNVNNSSNSANCNRNSSAGASNSSTVSNSSTINSSNRQNALLRDLIKIILLNDINSRRWNNQTQMTMPNMNNNVPTYM